MLVDLSENILVKENIWNTPVRTAPKKLELNFNDWEAPQQGIFDARTYIVSEG